MGPDDEILKTLQRIENLLKKSTSSADSGPAAAGSRASVLNRVMGNRQGNQDQKTYKASAAKVSDLGDAADGVSRKFNRLGKILDVTTGRFAQLNRSARVFARAEPGRAATGGGGGGGSSSDIGNPLAAMFGGRQGTEMQRQLGQLSSTLSITRVALISMVAGVGAALKPLVTDLFHLQARGISAASSLGRLYLDAALAGTSLQEYTTILSNAEPAAVRASNFKEFGAQLRTTSGQLGGLGVFGQTATELSATLANSTTVLGVPQAQLGDAMSRQVGVFAELRKSSMITADQFRALTEDLSHNQDVQSQLLGMAGPERAAALKELQMSQTIGRQMGATAAASKSLGDALLAQRKLTTAQRFQAAGTIRQAGSITGMDAGDSERLAQLARKKNRSASEKMEFTKLAGQQQARLEEMKNSNDVGQTYIAEQLQERLDASGIGTQLQEAANVALTAQSGPVKNTDIGKATVGMAEDAGKILTILQGIAKNPVASAIISVLGSAAFAGALAFGMSRYLTPILGKILGQSTRLATLIETVNAMGVTKAAGATKTVVGASKTVADAARTAPKAQWTTSLGASNGTKVAQVNATAKVAVAETQAAAKTGSGITKLFTQASTAVLNGGGMLMRSLRFVAKALPVVSSILDGVIEAFTGELAMAFNPSGGMWARIQGILSAALWAIPQFIVDAMGLIFGEKFMSPIQGIFDMLKVGVVGAVNVLLLGLTGIVGFFTDLLPDDSPLRKMVDAAKDSLGASITENAEALNKLNSNTGKASVTTLKSISAENTKTAADAEKQAAAAAAKVGGAGRDFNNVITSSTNLAADVVRTAAMIATPGTTQGQSVTPTPVNTQTETTNTNAQDSKSGASATPTSPLTDTLTAQFATIIQLLQSSLDAEVGQRAATEAMAFAMGRPWSVEQSLMFDRSTRTS